MQPRWHNPALHALAAEPVPVGTELIPSSLHAAQCCYCLEVAQTPTTSLLQLEAVYRTSVNTLSDWWWQHWLMFRKNKYATNYSSFQHRATVQSSFCLQEGSSVLTCCIATSAMTEGLLHCTVWSNAQSHFPLQHSEQHIASSWLAHFCHHLQTPSNSITLCHQLCTKVSICPCTVANRLSARYLSLSGQDAAMSCGLLPH